MCFTIADDNNASSCPCRIVILYVESRARLLLGKSGGEEEWQDMNGLEFGVSGQPIHWLNGAPTATNASKQLAIEIIPGPSTIRLRVLLRSVFLTVSSFLCLLSYFVLLTQYNSIQFDCFKKKERKRRAAGG
jgi:hypothetical protein